MNTSFLNLLIILVCIYINNCEHLKSNKIDGEVSYCQGFQAVEKVNNKKPTLSIDSASYCSAEKLIWQYDENDSKLSLLHTRQIRNCAAKLIVEAILNENSLTITETDTRDPNAGSGCDCPFDTYIEVPNITAESITIKYPKTTLILELKEGIGSFVLDSSQTEDCR